MKKYIAPSLKVVNVDNETILAGSTLGTASYNGQQTLLGNRRNAHYFDEEEELDFED